MTRIERRVLVNCAFTGALLTMVVVMAHIFGLLQVPESWMYDLRARYFQFFAPKPTDELVHLDMDDKALDVIGYWPWPRAHWAELIDEIHSAGAKAIALDILFTEPQKPEFHVVTDDSGKKSVEAEIDNDALFAAAIKRAGRVLMPASVALDPPAWNEIQKRAIALLEADLELTEPELISRLRAQGLNPSTFESGDTFVIVRREAAYRRVNTELSSDTITFAELRKKLLPRIEESIHSPVTRALEEQFERCRNERALARLGAELPREIPPLYQANVALAPIGPFSTSAGASAFVDYTTARDGILRSVPLVVNANSRAFPQMGLSLALLWLGATPQDLQYTADSVTVCCPDGRRIVIPTRTYESETLRRQIPMTFDIPWFGGRNWEHAYDWPNYARPSQHLPITEAWNPFTTRQRIIRNNGSADKALAVVHEVLGWPTFSAPVEDSPARQLAAERALKESESFLAAYREMKPDEINADGKVFLRAAESLKNYTEQSTLLKRQLTEQREKLARALKGKAVLIGWTATGRQDVTPTSLHARCPGVITHGVIFNSIVTGHFWRTVPDWVPWALGIALGLITAGISARFTPPAAFLITSLLGISYVAVNGFVLFDRMGYLVNLATPQIAMAAVWAGCTLIRIVIESQERARITRRFRAYVDPTLVNYVIERPNEVRLEGETRELTVCFSDLAGFTALSERLGERIVQLLNDFLGVQVPVIREQKGYVNKFLGDGIMYFFGAPIHNPDHAADAVRTSLRMQEKLVEFNQGLVAKALPTLSMRIGISTGMVVVGDAGSKDASDYTVLGDTVNFGSRLESVNKMLDTSVLISERTRQLIGSTFLVRPVGVLQVMGKTEGVAVFEVRGFADRATDSERQLCTLTEQMVEHYRQAKFDSALAIAGEIEQRFGPGKLTALYRKLCQQLIEHPPGSEFDGTIVFSEK